MIYIGLPELKPFTETLRARPKMVWLGPWPMAGQLNVGNIMCVDI